MLSNLRPTLPPLHTLSLPMPVVASGSTKTDSHHDRHEYPNCITTHKDWTRRVSNFSSTSSRTPSPSVLKPSGQSSSSLSSAAGVHHHPPLQRRVRARASFRLVPTSLDLADAVIVFVPPPKGGTSSSSSGKPLLLVGPALQRIRKSPPASGARIHAYRIVSSSGARRRRSS